jgi:hypothetical protein
MVQHNIIYAVNTINHRQPKLAPPPLRISPLEASFSAGRIPGWKTKKAHPTMRRAIILLKLLNHKIAVDRDGGAVAAGVNALEASLIAFGEIHLDVMSIADKTAGRSVLEIQGRGGVASRISVGAIGFLRRIGIVKSISGKCVGMRLANRPGAGEGSRPQHSATGEGIRSEAIVGGSSASAAIRRSRSIPAAATSTQSAREGEGEHSDGALQSTAYAHGQSLKVLPNQNASGRGHQSGRGEVGNDRAPEGHSGKRVWPLRRGTMNLFVTPRILCGKVLRR